jgi:hypothetical protein
MARSRIAAIFPSSGAAPAIGPIFRNQATLILSNGSDFTLSSAVLDNQLGAGIYFNNGSITISGSGIATNSGLLNLD